MFKATNLLIVDDDVALVKVFERLSADRGWTYSVARSGEEAMERLGSQVFEAAVVDIMLPGISGLQILEHMKKNGISTEVIIVTGVGSIETAVSAIRQGAYDYLTKPFDDIEKVSNLLEKAMDRYRLVARLKMLERKESDDTAFEGIVGRGKRIQEVFDTIESIAPTTSTVLVTGESGTGKELVARAIHSRSNRKDKPFIVINCAAIPVHLLESELFGHKKGSFTGAISDKKGLFEEADGGTVFLDEVGEIPPSVQVKLLRVLQESEIRAVGDNISKQVDVRLVAATNRDLSVMVKEGAFREDLYYRINVIGILLPPLRDRPEDIPTLSYYFLKKHCAKMKKVIERISIDALQALQNYVWVGNVRELENAIERAVVLANKDVISARDLPANVLGESFYLIADDSKYDLTKLSYQDAKDRALTAFNRMYIMGLLKEASGNISFASEKAGMDRSNFKKLIKKYSIDCDEFKKGT